MLFLYKKKFDRKKFAYLQYHHRERSNFQVSCVNISFFPCNKASKLVWILRGTRKDHNGIFAWDAGNFLEKLKNGHMWCMKFVAYTWRLIFSTPSSKVTRGMRGEPLICTLFLLYKIKRLSLLLIILFYSDIFILFLFSYIDDRYSMKQNM